MAQTLMTVQQTKDRNLSEYESAVLTEYVSSTEHETASTSRETQIDILSTNGTRPHAHSSTASARVGKGFAETMDELRKVAIDYCIDINWRDMVMVCRGDRIW